jgi:FlaA1/EpsC-like NDP-sugar epimerase
MLTGKGVLITGGSGSLARVLLRRLLAGELGVPDRIRLFSRDEAKQHDLRLSYQHRTVATDEVIYHNYDHLVQFQIGDVRDADSIRAALDGIEVVFHAAAMKQVPTCEYFPFEAARTNVGGAQNLVHAIRTGGTSVETVVGISTDKACSPVNVMGMTKALQERILVRGNLDCPGTRFICVRYGNVIASRGSVVPLFLEQIRNGGPLTVTTPEMTRFLLSLDEAVDVIFEALRSARPGEIYVPDVPSARIVDLAEALIGDRSLDVVFTQIRPGEKVHEVLVSVEEAQRTTRRGDYFVIEPLLPELQSEGLEPALDDELSSGTNPLPIAKLGELLKRHGVSVVTGERLGDLVV